MKKTIFWLLFTFLFRWWSWSFACTRVTLDKEIVRNTYDYVLAGTITKIEEAKSKKPLQSDDRLYFLSDDIQYFYYTFSIEKSFKDDIGTGEIIIFKAIDYLGCNGWWLTLWSQYILYVDSIKDSNYYQSSSEQIVYLENKHELSTVTKYDLWATSRWQKIFDFFTTLL